MLKFLGKMTKLFVHRMSPVYIENTEFILDWNILLQLVTTNFDFFYLRFITIKYLHACKNSDLISENNWEGVTQQQLSCDCPKHICLEENNVMIPSHISLQKFPTNFHCEKDYEILWLGS